jgi:uncharacterized protein YkwD
MLQSKTLPRTTSSLKLFILSGVVLCAVALPVQAQSPPSNAYQTLEYQVINQVHRFRSRSRTTPLKYDDVASIVARQHSEAMAEQGVFSLTLPDLGSLNDQLNYARVSARPLHTFIVLGKTPRDIFSQLEKLPALKDYHANAIALGLSQGKHPQLGNTYWATVILLDRMVDINPLPREVRLGQTLRVQVKFNSPYKNPRMPVTSPSGSVLRLRPTRVSNGQAFFDVRFPEKGRYTVEVLLDKPGLGPRVARILPVYAGETYPRKESEIQNTERQFKDTRSAAAYLLTLLNQERKKQGLGNVVLDTIMDNTAIAHSKDMALRGFFAHVNPDGQDPNARYRLRGGLGSVGENIVIEDQINAAHQQLMASPGHRANILQKDVTHVGIGVYFYKGRYYICQLFQSREKSQDIRSLRQRLDRWLDAYREQNEAGILLQDALLQGINQDYTQKMAQQDRLDYGGIRALGVVYAERGGSFQAMSTLVLNAHNFEDLVHKLDKYKTTLQDPRWERYGLGIIQSNSLSQGYNTLWVTLGLASD